MTEPNSKDNREALEDLTPEEIPEDNGPDLDNGPKDEQEEGDFSAKLKSVYEKVIAAAEEYHRVFFQSQQWEVLQKVFPGITEEQGINISFIADDLMEYLPEIQEAIEEREKKTGKPITITDLLEGIEYVNEEKDRPGPCLLEDFLEEAQQIRKDRGKKLPTVKYKPATTQQIQLNIDKLMRRLFNPRTTEKAIHSGVQLYIREQNGAYKPQKGEIPGQLSFLPVSYEKGGEKELTLYYSIDYDGDALKKLGLPGETTAEDYFILSVIADAAIAGNTDISPNKLYKEFTGKEPNKYQKTQFVNRLMKMAGTMVDMDDREVMKAWGQETYNQYYGQLAPLKFINKRHVVNGGITDSMIKITDFPDILRTGRQIGQYITVPKSLLYVKKKDGRAIKRTPRFYELLMILLKEIARIKRGKRVNKITYSWIYNELDIEEKDYHGREDTLETLYVILDHFKREKWITGYKETTTKSTGEVGVIFTWNDTEGKAKPIEKKTRGKGRRAKE